MPGRKSMAQSHGQCSGGGVVWDFVMTLRPRYSDGTADRSGVSLFRQVAGIMQSCASWIQWDEK